MVLYYFLTIPKFNTTDCDVFKVSRFINPSGQETFLCGYFIVTHAQQRFNTSDHSKYMQVDQKVLH